ncbi:MAG: DUF4013 domain-containing protein [Trichodesmium sp. MAG_R03]|nr:DUF4013 domain-containing protein [Trichodesmium sp. MAG_R03]
MTQSNLQKIKDKVKEETKEFTRAPIFPFLQEDWKSKMPLFFVLGFIPIFNIILHRGWRIEYIHRLGWGYEKILPSPGQTCKLFDKGITLWVINVIFILIPSLIMNIISLSQLTNFWFDLIKLFYLLFRSAPIVEYFQALWDFLANEFIYTILDFFIENFWLLIYIPIYRIGTIRFALTGKLINSYFSIRKNFKFLFKNFIEIIFLYIFNTFNFILVLLVDLGLAITIIGVPLIPVVTSYLYYWSSGYKHGMLARLMVEQEGLNFEIDVHQKYIKSNH